METLFIVCGLTVLVALIALGFRFIYVSPSPQLPSLGVCSPSDSPYVPILSQEESYHQPLHRQLPPPRLAIQYPQTSSRYSTLQAPSSSQPSLYQPHRLPSAQYPPLAATPPLSRGASMHKPICYITQQPSRPAARASEVSVVPVVDERPVARAPEIPVASPSIATVTEPVQSHVPQSPSQHTPYQPDRQPSVRFPVQPALPISPDVAPVAEPVLSHIPRRTPRFSAPELATRVPEVDVTPIVTGPHENADSLRLEARNERSRMEECLKQSREAFDGNNPELAKQLSLRGETHRANMVRLDKEASMKIFQEHNQRPAGSNTIDLHRLFVSEAKVHFYDAVQEVRDRGKSLLHVIVGRGNHSKNRVAKIKRVIQEYGISLGLGVKVNPRNDGRLVVSLNPS